MTTPAAGLCRCGCGHPTPPSPRNYAARGHVKGEPMPFLPGHSSVRRGDVHDVDPMVVYADQLRHAAALIIGAVHDEGPGAVQEAIDRALIIPAPGNVDPAVALITVLAAQVDPTASAETRLGWVLAGPRQLAEVAA